MTGSSKLDRLESRISSGLADVFASSLEDSFPEVPQHAWQDTIDQQRRSTAAAPLSEAPMDRFSDSGSHAQAASSADTLPGDAFRPTTRTAPQDFMLPWAQYELPNRDEAASAETLRNSDSDDWLYLEQIASYLDIHQKTPIDVHTGFNYVEGSNAARALGLPALTDSQVMLLMRAGLMVHHYASSATPWRDALSAVEYELQAETKRESDREHEQRRFMGQRLMKQFAHAVICCNESTVLKYVRLWRVRLMHARAAGSTLLAFDEHTLLLPYFDGWKAQKQAATLNTQTAEELRMRQVTAFSLGIIRKAVTVHKDANTRAVSHFEGLCLKQALRAWLRNAKNVQRNFSSADDRVKFFIRSEHLEHWRTLRLNNAISRRLELQQLTVAMGQWRLARQANSRRASLSMKTRRSLLFRVWTSEFSKTRGADLRSVEAGAAVQRNNLGFLLRHVWLESKVESSCRKDRVRRCLMLIRIWRAETRLSCYRRLQDRDTLFTYLESWRTSVDDIRRLNDKGDERSRNEGRELQRALLHMMRSRTNEDAKRLEPTLRVGKNVAAGRAGLRTLRASLRRCQSLWKTSETYHLRSLLHMLALENSRKKQIRLDGMTLEAAASIQTRVVLELIRAWRLQTQAHALDLGRIEQASQHGDCVFALGKWIEATNNNFKLAHTAEAYFAHNAVGSAFSTWVARMDIQVEAEVEAATQATIRKALLAKRVVRSWRRQNTSMHIKVAEWREDANRQLATIYFRTLDGALRLRHRRDMANARNSDIAVLSPQHTPSRRQAISPRALELWTTRDPVQKRNVKTADEWGATPLSRQPGFAAPRMLSTPTKPARLMRDLNLEAKNEQ